MNQNWAEQNKKMQSLLKKNTFDEGIAELLTLREALMQEILSWQPLSKETFCAIPYLNSDGYHSKTVAYSLWHIFRIEDIVVHTLICRDEEVLFSGNYAEKMHAPIVTTGNELQGVEIAEFSRALELPVLYEYMLAVKASTDAWLKTLRYEDLKRSYTQEDKDRLKAKQTVSDDESAAWLIDYWCGRDLKGLIKMPLSRHWIMHIEAALRIMRKAK